MSDNPIESLLDQQDASSIALARIVAELASNSLTRKPLVLDYFIELRLAHEALVELGPLGLGARSWQDLEQSRWTPGAPRTVYADGEAITSDPTHGRLEISGRRADIECKHISFGRIGDRGLPARIDLVVPGPPPRHWQVEADLELGPIRILGDVFHKPRPDVSAALELAEPYLNLSEFNADVEHGIVLLVPSR